MTIINLKKKYIFISNKYCYPQMINNILYQDGYDSCYNGIGMNYVQLKKILEKKNINIDEFYIFGFIRDPIDRLLECFKNDYRKNIFLKKYGIIFGYNIQSFITYVSYNYDIDFNNFEFMFHNQEGELSQNINIFKYENIIESLIEIFNKININYDVLEYKKNIKLQCNKIIPPNEFNIPKLTTILIKQKYKYDCKYYNY
jgi:hypothetical protein